MNQAEIIDRHKEAGNELVFSYLTLRNLIGIGGMLLPFVIAIFPSRPSKYYGFEFSISDYYYTDRGDFLVVLLCIIGAFLITYKGYSRLEMALTTLAGICGIGVAFVPTGKACAECLYSVHNSDGGVFKALTGSWWHLAFAGTFFLCLGIMCLVYFTKGDDQGPDKKQKRRRNKAFYACGWIIIGCLALLVAYFLFRPKTGSWPVVYILETVGVEAFGFSWLVKGQTLWKDKKNTDGLTVH